MKVFSHSYFKSDISHNMLGTTFSLYSNIIILLSFMKISKALVQCNGNVTKISQLCSITENYDRHSISFTTVKFRFSTKATKFEEISKLICHLVKVQIF